MLAVVNELRNTDQPAQRSLPASRSLATQCLKLLSHTVFFNKRLCTSRSLKANCTVFCPEKWRIYGISCRIRDLAGCNRAGFLFAQCAVNVR